MTSDVVVLSDKYALPRTAAPHFRLDSLHLVRFRCLLDLLFAIFQLRDSDFSMARGYVQTLHTSSLMDVRSLTWDESETWEKSRQMITNWMLVI